MPKSQKSRKCTTKSIKVWIYNGDDEAVKVTFGGGQFTPAEFTAMFMGVLEAYTAGLLEVNDPKDVYSHFNSVFGTFLDHILPAKDANPEYKEFKERVDSTLGAEATDEVRAKTEDNRMAAYILCRDILVSELGMEEASADVLLNKRLNIVQPKEA